MIIYKLTSPSGKSYIGLTKGTLKNRWYQHTSSWKKLKRQGVTDYRGKSGSPLLYFAFDKYGEHTWTKEILFETDDYDALCEKEIEFIFTFNTTEHGYNVLSGGQRGNFGRRLDIAHRQRQSESKTRYWKTDEGLRRRKEMSEKMKDNQLPTGRVPHNKGKTGLLEHTEETKRIISSKLKGLKRTDEQRQRLSEAKKGIPQTEEHIRKRAEAKRGTKQTDHQKEAARAYMAQSWLVTHPDGRQETLTNLRQFCKDHKLSQGNLCTSGRTKGYRAQKLETTT